MKTNNILNFSRLGLLLRRQILSNGRSLLIAFGGVAGFLLIVTLLVAYFDPSELNNLKSLYFSAMFIGGFIMTSNMYAELHQIQRSYSYLTLPVSVSERLLSGWIISGIIFPAVSLLVIALIVLLSNLIMALLVESAHFQSLFYEGSLQVIKIYMITQTVFLLGAVYFRKNNFLKTILALFLVMVVINLYIGLVGWTLFGSFTDGNMMIDESSMAEPMETLFTVHFPAVSRFVFNWLFGPFFLVTTWFSLKERQV
jgi:hypothetical protein